jgi:hypothetical protein
MIFEMIVLGYKHALLSGKRPQGSENSGKDSSSRRRSRLPETILSSQTKLGPAKSVSIPEPDLWNFLGRLHWHPDLHQLDETDHSRKR